MAVDKSVHPHSYFRPDIRVSPIHLDTALETLCAGREVSVLVSTLCLYL